MYLTSQLAKPQFEFHTSTAAALIIYLSKTAAPQGPVSLGYLYVHSLQSDSSASPVFACRPLRRMKMATDEQIDGPGTKNHHATVDDVRDNTIENTTRMSV